jgi:hypothetical protein
VPASTCGKIPKLSVLRGRCHTPQPSQTAVFDGCGHCAHCLLLGEIGGRLSIQCTMWWNGRHERVNHANRVSGCCG